MSANDSSALIQGWLLRHRQGEAAASVEVLTHCQNRLKILTRRMLKRYPGVRRAEDTSDVFHNVVFRLMSSLRVLRFETPADFFRLAARQINWALIDLTRKQRVEFSESLESAGIAAGIAGNPREQDPTHLAAWEDVHAKIAALPEELRSVFDLLYYQGLTQEDTAGLLGLSVRTVKRRWLDARLRLMQSLGNLSPF